MKKELKKLIGKREKLLERMAELTMLIKGSHLERYSTCGRPNCKCHQGQKHGPRSYVVVYKDKRQRQVYIPVAQLEAAKHGMEQHEQLEQIVKEITDINLRLMREGVLAETFVQKNKRRTKE